jgi:hypothetical protein
MQDLGVAERIEHHCLHVADLFIVGVYATRSSVGENPATKANRNRSGAPSPIVLTRTPSYSGAVGERVPDLSDAVLDDQDAARRPAA